MCRCEKMIDKEALNKISLFCNVKNNHVIPALNAKNIYEVPSLYYKAGLDRALLELIGLKEKKHPLNLKPWDTVVKKINNPSKEVKIGIVGKYTDLKDSYKSLNEALVHGGIANDSKTIIKWINSERITNIDQLRRSHRNFYVI